MALSGTLETFGLPDVLRLLASTKKTGRLALDGDRGTGDVWVDGGDIVAAGATGAVVDELDAVLFELLRFADASFEFDAGATPPATDERRTVDDALGVAEARLEEWREIESVVPSLDVRVRMVPEVPEAVTVSPDVWRLLALVGTGTSGHQVARHLAEGEFEVCRTLRDLVDGGMVELTADVSEPAASVEVAPEASVEVAPEAPVPAPDPFAVGVDPADEVDDEDEPLSELALLSPKAAAAVEAMWSDDVPEATEDEAAEPGPQDEAAEGAATDDLDQNLLLRFLSSAKH